MAIELNESLASKPAAKGKKWLVKVIESGWGSSGYYPAEVLASDGPKVFRKGTKVFWNHPTLSEANDRPERDLQQLAGKLVSDAKFDGTGLVAEVEFYSHYAPILKEMAEDVGLSIRAFGESRMGEAGGRQGPIIEALVDNPLTSVDVVTVAGAGGKFISLLESYKIKDEAASSDMEGNESMITKEDFEVAIADLKATFVDALTPLRESVSVLIESATAEEEPAVEPELEPEVEETTEETEVAAEQEAEALDPVEVAEKFNESGLPKIALKRISESLKAGSAKTLDELIEDEKAYAASLRESVATPAAAEVVGIVHEAAAKSVSTAADELNAIVSRITKK